MVDRSINTLACEKAEMLLFEKNFKRKAIKKDKPSSVQDYTKLYLM